MSKTSIDADAMLRHAAPIVHQRAHEVQPYGHLVKMPIALSETACREAVDNLNQLVADTITLRDLYKKHHWQVMGPTFVQLHLLLTSTTRNRTIWWTALRNESSCLVALASPWRTTWQRQRSFRGRQGA